jgi:hypothetical protein
MSGSKSTDQELGAYKSNKTKDLNISVLKSPFEQDDGGEPKAATVYLQNQLPYLPYSRAISTDTYTVAQSSNNDETSSRRNSMPTYRRVENHPRVANMDSYPVAQSTCERSAFEQDEGDKPKAASSNLWNADLSVPNSRRTKVDFATGLQYVAGRLNNEKSDWGLAARLNMDEIDPAAKAQIEYAQRLFGIPTMVEIKVANNVLLS